MRNYTRLLLAALAFLLCKNTYAQMPVKDVSNVTRNRTCHTPVPPAAWDQWFNRLVAEHQAQMAAAKQEMAMYTIPVIVHVIHGGQQPGIYPNLSQAQINSQIAVLNADFAGTGYNSSQLPAAFSSARANCNIAFSMAQLDPEGNPLQEPGIHRLDWRSISPSANPLAPGSSAAFQTFFDDSIKPVTIWDPTRYFNIWVSDVKSSSVDLLGYATFPIGTYLQGIYSGNGTATSDGVWIWANSFGSTGTLHPQYNRGRTATHEIGHWLGLRHIWGDSNCGEDYCNDTPKQQSSNVSCPNYPKVSCNNNPDGEMFMNFMDYCDDECLYMFTWNQTGRMHTAMTKGIYRKDLTASSATLCNLPSQAPVASFNISGSACMNAEVHVQNETSGMPGPFYTWTIEPAEGHVIYQSPTGAEPTIVFTAAGSYNVSMTASNSAGSSTMSQFIEVNDCGIPAGILKQDPEPDFRLVPNPNAGLVVIEGEYNRNAPLSVSLYNALGARVYSFSGGTGGAMSLDLSGLPDGVYIASIQHGGAEHLKKLVLSR